jgi:hypothetical protein
MRFSYSINDSSQNEFDSLPWVPLVLRREQYTVEAHGLVDSGATVNVMPYELGLELGATWENRRAIIQLAGNLGNQPATPFFAIEFDICFYRSKMEFEIKPKLP